jgi:hypothetical protein
MGEERVEEHIETVRGEVRREEDRTLFEAS